MSLSCLSLLCTTLSHLSRLCSLFLLNYLSLFSLLFLRFLFWSEMAHRDVCVSCILVCALCVVVWLYVSLWLYCAVLCWSVWCVCCFCSLFLLKNNAVCTFNTLPCLTSVCHVTHGRFDGTHGSVLNVHTGTF